MTQTMAIFFATTLVVLATLIPTYIISKRSAVSEDDWAVADRSLPIYVVIGTQFASAMGGGILVGHLGNAYLNGVAILIYGFLTALPFFFVMIRLVDISPPFGAVGMVQSMLPEFKRKS